MKYRTDFNTKESVKGRPQREWSLMIVLELKPAWSCFIVSGRGCFHRRGHGKRFDVPQVELDGDTATPPIRVKVSIALDRPSPYNILFLVFHPLFTWVPL